MAKRMGLVGVWLALLLLGAASEARAQVATTTVADTVYEADGTAASGTVIVSWPSFTTAGGSSVPSGSSSTTLGAGGALSISLAPNAGATPMGTYYTVVYHLGDGSVSHEYWVVPVSGMAVNLRAVRSSVLPTSVAMQTVSKAYVDTAIAVAVSGHSQYPKQIAGSGNGYANAGVTGAIASPIAVVTVPVDALYEISGGVVCAAPGSGAGSVQLTAVVTYAHNSATTSLATGSANCAATGSSAQGQLSAASTASALKGGTTITYTTTDTATDSYDVRLNVIQKTAQ